MTLQSEHAPYPDSGTTAKPLALPFSAVVGFMLTTLYFVLTQLLPDTGRAEFLYSTVSPAFHIFSPMRGFTLEQLVSHVLRVLVLGPGLLCLSFGMARMLQLSAAEPLRLQRAHVYICLASLITTAAVMLFVLHGHAIVDDEITYAAMARLFARGQLAEALYPGQLLDVFEVRTHAGITGKYLFGEPMLQLLGVLVGLPALLHIPSNALSLYALYRSVQLLFGDRKLAAVSCGLLAISPTFILCGATGLSQPTSLACVMLCTWGYALASSRPPAGSEGDAEQARRELRAGLLAGAGLGFGLSVRVQALAPAGAVVGVLFVLLAVRERRLRPLLAFAGASLLGVAAIAAYNLAVTGDALTLPWFLQGAGSEHYGFVRVWPKLDFVHTPLGALQNLGVVAVRMNSWLFGWPLVLLLIWRRSALQRVLRHGAIFVWVTAALIVFELGYYSTGTSDVGPIYHFETLPCLCVIAAQCLLELWQRRPELALMGVVIHVMFGTGSFLWEQTARLSRLHAGIYEQPLALMARMPAHSLLLFPRASPCKPPFGWVTRPFPLVDHDPRADVVSYLIARPEHSQALSRHFPDRSCFYLAHDRQLEASLVPCSMARTDPEPSCTRAYTSAQQLALWLAAAK